MGMEFDKTREDKVIKVQINKEYVRLFGKRRGFREATEFLDTHSGKYGRILSLYGIRRSGKTVLMQQLALYKNVDYFYLVKDGATMSDVYNVLESELSAGAKIVLLDEITNAEDFVTDSSLLADKYASSGVDIVIAGTDSLGIYFAERDELLDRMHKVDMSYISFAEHSEVVNSRDLDEYIMYGGLMRRDMGDDEAITDEESAKRFLDSAVAGNIAKSLSRAAYVTGFSEVRKYTEADIELIVRKLVEIYNGELSTLVINKSLEKVSISSAIKDKIKALRGSEGLAEKYRNLDLVNLRSEYRNLVNLVQGLSKPATDELITELDKAFRVIGFLYVGKGVEFDLEEGVSESVPRTILLNYIMQTAVKYHLLKAAVLVFHESECLNLLSSSERKELADNLSNDIMGRMTENITLTDVRKLLGGIKTNKNDIFPRYDVFKVNFDKGSRSLGEIDMIITDSAKNVHYAFEIKHTSNIYLGEGDTLGGQAKNLVNTTYLYLTEKYYGKRKMSFVLYNGVATKIREDLYYLNIVDFLITLDKVKELDKALTLLIGSAQSYDVLLNGEGVSLLSKGKALLGNIESLEAEGVFWN